MSQKTVSPGKFLVAARDALALTQEEIAKQLHLSVTLIRDLEQDRYASMGARIYVRGYLCSYARVVGVSDAKITALLDDSGLMSVVSQPVASIIEGAPVRNVTSQALRLNLPRWEVMACAAGVLLLIVIFIVKLSMSTPTAPVVKKVVATAERQTETLAAPVFVTQSPPVAIAQPALQTVAPPITAHPIVTNVQSNAPFRRKHRVKK